MKTTDFDYDLPVDLIAQVPVEPRDSAQLLVLDRKTGSMSHTIFTEIGEYLHAGDLLVLNQTRVIPARLYGYKVPTGGKVEVLLIKPLEGQIWEVLVGGKGLKIGKIIQIDRGPAAEIIAQKDGSHMVVKFDQKIETFFATAGHVPLPPYIHVPLNQPERYQTVYAKENGSVAAPTAGLHFTPKLIGKLESKGVRFAYVTLHIGLDTFAPVSEEKPHEHKVHTEWCILPVHAADQINQTRLEGSRIIAIGTTSVRVLETAAQSAPKGLSVAPYEGSTDLFILPGHNFQVVDGLVTNFHLPKSTLIMLVSAFAGRQTILAAYQEAIRAKYRFYSFGDAMLIL